MRNKYHNKPLDIDGMHFDSRGEFERWQELRLLERAGQISNLRRQVAYELIPAQYEPSTVDSKGRIKRGKLIERKCTYIADFAYQRGSDLIVEDYKGVETDAFKIKRKLMLWEYGIRITLTRG